MLASACVPFHRFTPLVIAGVCWAAGCAQRFSQPPPGAAPAAAAASAHPWAAPAAASASACAQPATDETSCYPIPGRVLPATCLDSASDREDADTDSSAAIDDDIESQSDEEVQPASGEHPFARLSDAEFTRRVRKNPAELGPMSVGFPDRGWLYNGVQMPSGPNWQVVDPAHAWGTQETIDSLTLAIERVSNAFADTPRVVIGHISARMGGRLTPHKSHQSGRDVDVGYYYITELRWFARAREDNLDRARTWTLVKTLVRQTRVDLILIDRSIQNLLRAYALAQGEDPDWVRRIFDGEPGKRATILHAHGHADHIHVRFLNPIAQETGRRAGPTLLQMGVLRTPTRAPSAPLAPPMIVHRVVRGETLGMIARKYAVSVQQIRAANGLLSDRLKPKQELKIPKPPTPLGAPAVVGKSKPSANGGGIGRKPGS